MEEAWLGWEKEETGPWVVPFFSWGALAAVSLVKEKGVEEDKSPLDKRPFPSDLEPKIKFSEWIEDKFVVEEAEKGETDEEWSDLEPRDNLGRWEVEDDFSWTESAGRKDSNSGIVVFAAVLLFETGDENA